jgi:hypothetical protein
VTDLTKTPNRPMRTNEIAGILGWSTERTARWLDGLARRDPSIIVRVNGRRMTTLASLRRVVPDIAKRFASDSDLEDVREEQGSLRRDIESIAVQLREFREKAWGWYRGAERRLSALEKVRNR